MAVDFHAQNNNNHVIICFTNPYALVGRSLTEISQLSMVILNIGVSGTIRMPRK
jgi:hypothetical protein